jgi:hypothetical protein
MTQPVYGGRVRGNNPNVAQPAPWRRPGILVGRPVGQLTSAERAFLLTAVGVLAGRDPEELDAQLSLVVRAGAGTRRALVA